MKNLTKDFGFNLAIVAFFGIPVLRKAVESINGPGHAPDAPSPSDQIALAINLMILGLTVAVLMYLGHKEAKNGASASAVMQFKSFRLLPIVGGIAVLAYYIGGASSWLQVIGYGVMWIYFATAMLQGKKVRS